MNRVGTLLVLLAVMTSGCAFADGPLFSDAPTPDGGKGTFYIYRGPSALAYTPTIKINDVPFVELAHNGYSYAYLAPGVYKLTVAYIFIAGLPPLVTEFAVAEGQVMFLRLNDSGYSSVLRERPQDEALKEIKDHRYVKPLNSSFL